MKKTFQTITLILILATFCNRLQSQNNFTNSLSARIGFTYYEQCFTFNDNVYEVEDLFSSEYFTQLSYDHKLSDKHYLGFTYNHLSIKSKLQGVKEYVGDSLSKTNGNFIQSYMGFSIDYSYQMVNLNIHPDFDILIYSEAGFSIFQLIKHNYSLTQQYPDGTYHPTYQKFSENTYQDKLVPFHFGGHLILDIQYVFKNSFLSHSFGLYYMDLQEVEKFSMKKANYLGIKLMAGYGVYF